MDPSGIYWKALYERLKGCGYNGCLVHCQAVRNNRKTMQEGTRKTDATDAYSVLDLLRQGKFFLPVARDLALKAAYRLMPRPMALKKRSVSCAISCEPLSTSRFLSAIRCSKT